MNIKKYSFIFSLILVAVLVALAFVFRPEFLFGPPARIPVSFILTGNAADSRQALEKEFKEFENLFPKWRVEVSVLAPRELETGLKQGTLQPAPELYLSPAPAYGAADPAQGQSAAWTGSSWALYANLKVLKPLGLDPSTLPPSAQRWLPDLETPEAFAAVLAKIKARGQTPIALGSLYGWPQAAWLQHLSAFVQGPEAALALGDGSKPVTDPVWKPALDLWTAWEKAGYFGSAWKNQDWPQSVLDFASGKAGFCLLSADLLGTIPTERRADISWVNFPVGKGTPWTIGSLWYLNLKPKASEGASDLYRFLTSPGVTGRLQLATGKTFHSAGGGLKVLQSVTGQTQSPLIESLTAGGGR